MLCIHQNQSSSFKGPISHPSSPTNPFDTFPGLEDDFSDISADFSFDDINILDQMFNNQQSTFDSIGLDQGQSLSSTYSPTDSSSVQQLNFQTSSGLNFNIDNSNNNNSNNEANITISSNNPSSFIGSTETSLSSAPTTPNSATLPSFTEIYSSRNFTSAQHPHPQQSHSGLTVTGSNADDASSFFKFDDIGLNDDDNTSLSEVSFASVSMKKLNQGSGSLMDLSSIKQENECEDDIVNVSNQISIQSAINQQSKNQQLQLHHHHHHQHQHQHQHHQQNQLQQQLLHSQLHRINQLQQVNQQQFTSSSTHQDVAFTGISSVASSPGYISMSSTRSTPNLDQYQSQYQQSISHQPQRQHQQLYPQPDQFQNICSNTSSNNSSLSINLSYKHNIDLSFINPCSDHHLRSSQSSPIPRSPYQAIDSPMTPNIASPGSNHTISGHSIKDQEDCLRSSLSSLVASSNIHETSLKTGSIRSFLKEHINVTNKIPRVSKLTTSSTSPPSSALTAATGQQLQQLCAVCGDNAACQHYGVRTCEGCKGFFKRTVQKGSKYVCLGNKDCPVDKRRRNRCQFCRFQKCLAVGMVKEVVRTDNLKGRRGRLPSKPKSPQESPPSPPISTITALVRAHVDTCPDISNLDYSHYCEIDDSDLTPEAILSYHQQFVDVLSSALETCRNFAEKISGFTDLNKHDQDLLFYSSFFEIIALRTAYQNRPGSRKIILPNGIVLHRNQAKLLFGSWFTNLESFAQRFAQIDIDISAFACLSGLSLITNRHGLVDPSRVEALQMKIIESLRDHVTYNADAQKKSHYFSSILSKLPDLRSLAMDGLRHLHEIKLESIVTIPEPISRLLTNLSYY